MLGLHAGDRAIGPGSRPAGEQLDEQLQQERERPWTQTTSTRCWTSSLLSSVRLRSTSSGGCSTPRCSPTGWSCSPPSSTTCATTAGRVAALTTNPTELCAIEGVCDAPCVLTLTGTRPHRQGVHACHGGLVPLSYCPRSSLPAQVLAWLAARLAHLLAPRPPGQGGNPPLPLEVRLDAVAAVALDGLSYRRAGRAVGISKTEVGDSMDLLLPELAAIGYCQPDGTFITTLEELRQWLGEMARSGEAVCVDGLATRVQRPRSWANRRSCTTPSATPTPPRGCR